jgi:hypothetical protein
MKTPSIFVTSVLLGAATARATVVVTSVFEVGPGGVGSTFTPSYAVATNDLINGMTPSAFSGDFAVTEFTGGLPVLTDGSYGVITEPGGAADRTHGAFGIAGGGTGSGTSVTYSLALNPLGYNISSVAVYGGWNDNGRDQQLFTVSYSVVGDSAFVTLPLTVNFNPAVGANLQTANRSIISDNALPFLASNVDAIRFDFPAGVENGYTGYAELDVIGTAVVPEPGAALLSALAGCGLMVRRRR